MLVELADVKLSIRGKPILHDVDLHMESGDIYGLLGPNGAGKSTTLSVVTGLRAAAGGSIEVLGHDPWSEREKTHRKLGVLPEQMGFYDWMSAADYLRWFGALYGRRATDDDISEQLGRVGLEAGNRQSIGTYSRGMKQRLGLARALLNDPQLLILDEPTNGLDPRGRREIHDVLQGLSRQRGIGVLLCTHLLDDVDRLCTRIGIIHRGRTVLEGRLAELLASRQAAERYRLRVLAPPDPAAMPPGVTLLGKEGEWVHVQIGAGLQADAVWRALMDAGWRISEIRSEGGGLEEVYLSLTTEEAAA
jgi:ABC-2 type transport system ATP-binding protein